MTRKVKFLFYILSVSFIFFTLFAGCFLLFQTEKYALSLTEKCTTSLASEELQEVDNLFLDYAQFQVKPEYNTLDKLNAYKEKVKNLSSYKEEDFARAESVIKGLVRFDARREFSTYEDALNALHQYGAIRNYCSDTLKMSRFGSDRQPTGIYAYAGDTITIYLECDSAEYRPYVVFTQFEGSSSSFKSNDKPLLIGKNVFEFPDLKKWQAGYSKDVVLGGPIHISNPRTHEMQGNVRIYIEGGDFYPIFRKGGDEKLFLEHLKQYYSEYQNHKTTMIDMAELVADHVYFTISASACYNAYVKNGHNINDNLISWDNYVRMLLEYSGVTFDRDAEDYKEINEHLNINIRDTQNLEGAGAYAGNDHVGIYKGSTWENIVVYVGDGTAAMSRDWGFAHEIGHMLDTRGLELAETTNNMYSKYAEMHLFKGAVPSDAPTHDHMQATFDHLVSDDTAAKSFFQTDDERKNYFVWWYLEAAFPGFWPRLQNLYRYETQNISLGGTERMVYLCSLAAGIDLSYYFERWGYYKLSYESPFKESEASEDFRTLMAEAVESERITNTFKPKLWYQNAETYENLARKNLSLTDRLQTLFDGTQSCEIVYVHKTENQYTIKLKGIDDNRLLGFEIIDAATNKVVGFTYSDSIVLSLSGSPKFQAVAYDIYFRTSKPSAVAEVSAAQNICQLNGNGYSSLERAIADAQDGDIVYLMDDIREEGLYVDKNITIAVGQEVENNITIFATTREAFYAKKSLKILGREDAKIIFDGGGAKREMGFIRIDGSGDLTVENAEFRNSTATASAAALYSINKGDVNFKNCRFENLSGVNGGAIFIVGSVQNAVFEGCSFTNNSATNSGGAIKAYSQQLKILNCTFSGNKAKEDTVLSHSCPGLLILQGTSVKAQDGDSVAIEAYSGDMRIFSDCVLDGLIYSTKTVVLDGGIFSAAEGGNLGFDFSHLAEGQPAFASENFVFSDDAPGKLNAIDKNNSYLLHDGQIFIGNEKFTVKFVFDGQTVEKQVAKGEKLTLDGSGLSLDKKYPATFNEAGGQSYGFGEEIVVTKDLTFEVTLEDLIELKWRYLENEKTEYIVPGKVYLPTKSVAGWLIDGQLFMPNTFVEVKKNTVIMALYESYFYVVFKDGAKVVAQQICLYNQAVTSPNLREGYVWESGGKVFAPESDITITADTVFNSKSGSVPTPKNLQSLEISLSKQKFVYNGAHQMPEVTIMDGEYKLALSEDYEVEYLDNLNAGNARVVICALGQNYCGSTTLYFVISKAEGSGVVKIQSYEYGQPASEIVVESKTNPLEGMKVYYKLHDEQTFTQQQPKDAGFYDVKVVLAPTKNYNECVLFGSFTIEKAESPIVNTTIHHSGKAEKLSDITLPDGFVWENENIEITANKMRAKAIYKGEGASNYVITEIYFDIIIEKPQTFLQTNLVWIVLGVVVSVIIFVSTAIALTSRKRKNFWKNR